MFFTTAQHRIISFGPYSLSRACSAQVPRCALGGRRYGLGIGQKESMDPTITLTSQCAVGSWEEARAVAHQVGSSVWWTAVVCFLCILMSLSRHEN